MIQGYAIYLRTHLATGKQYAGCVWGTKGNWTAEKACMRRWRQEDRAGIRGLFGGFDSKIILSEKRSAAPQCSEGLYRIRIAVDENHVVNSIPITLRLNVAAPLSQLDVGFFNEEYHRIGGRAAGREVKQRAGRCAAKTHKLNGTGFYSSAEDVMTMRSQNGTVQGRRNAEDKIGVCGRSPEQMVIDARKGGSIGGLVSGANHRKNRTGICGMSDQQRRELGQIAGIKNVESGRLAKAREVLANKRFIKTVAWG